MKINSVTIKNFRCYYGESTINFDTSGKVTLIYGDSGYGKTSFLQFFNWMFYSNPDFGVNNEKPLFNSIAFQECGFNKTFSVYGKIDFEHLGTKFSLRKEEVYRAKVTEKDTICETTDIDLYEMVDDNWSPCKLEKNEIERKIKSILPKELSKYFLLDGEKAREIVLDKRNLKKAIHSLFGLDAYEQAISHIGNVGKRNSVLGLLSDEMNKSIIKTNNNDPIRLKSALEKKSEEIESYNNQLTNIKERVSTLRTERDTLFIELGKQNQKDDLLDNKRLFENTIKQLIKRNKEILHNIGDVSYKNYPYLFLSGKISDSSLFLRKMNAKFINNDKNIFEHLRKELLEEIKDKGICVCGKELDDQSFDYINNVLKTMLPHSYTDDFGKFVKKAKRQVTIAKSNSLKIDELYDEYTQHLHEIHQFEEENNKIDITIKDLEKNKDKRESLDKLDNEIGLEERKEAALRTNMAQAQQVHRIWSKDYDRALSNAKVSSEFTNKKEFFETIKNLLEKQKTEQELNVKNTINKCVRDTFKLLTTQTGIDAEKIEFINDDFTLRSSFLSGGQKSVDVFSYVIGIVKALKHCQMENNENFIIVDAPFAFTDGTQSKHVFRTLPSVTQTILLTLDLNKIDDDLNDTSLYDLYVLKTSNSQDKTKIERGDLNAIKQ